MGACLGDADEMWEQRMIEYEQKVFSFAELEEPYQIDSQFIKITMDDQPF